MLDGGKYEKLRMVVDFTLFSTFKVNVSKWEPIFFPFLVAAFFVARYMIATLLLRCSMSIRPKNWKDVKSCLRERNPKAL